jgi:DNA-binding MurR/RpiR family transcriptional regulator
VQTDPPALRDALENGFPGFTAAERKIAQVVLAEYPYGGLVPIQELARRAGVSAPSITRFVGKLGCAGFHDFQRRLIGELKESALSPVELKRDDVAEGAEYFLPAYAGRVAGLVARLGESVAAPQFDALCALLADPRIGLHLIGGRVTDSIAHLLAAHLGQIRGGVRRLPTDPEEWPPAVLGLGRRDALLVFDIRRYDPRLAVLAERAAGRGATVVAITDRWLSPVSLHARMTFTLPIDVGTPWDTHVALVALVEAAIIRVSERDWTGTSRRIAEIDRLRSAFDPLREG